MTMNRQRHVSNFRYRISKPSQTVGSQSKASWLDIWLPRLSHLSQFGLFLFTIATIYFTVIPLYQKALLDEAIAKKEIDLKEATAAVVLKESALKLAQAELAQNTLALSKAKRALEQAELKTYVQKRGYDLNTLVTFSGAECTGLFIREPINAIGQETKRPEAYVQHLQLDIAECLQKEFQKSRLRAALQPRDLERFQAELSKTTDTLRTMKTAAIRASEELPAIAQLDPKVLRPPGPFTARAEAFLARARIINPLPSEEQRRQDFERTITGTRNALSYEYTEAARGAFRKLSKITWLITDEMPTSQ